MREKERDIYFFTGGADGEGCVRERERERRKNSLNFIFDIYPMLQFHLRKKAFLDLFILGVEQKMVTIIHMGGKKVVKFSTLYYMDHNVGALQRIVLNFHHKSVILS